MKKITIAIKNNRLAFSLIIFGSFLMSLTMIKSGWKYEYGMGFWGANGHDGIWHISLTESLKRGSMQMPVFAGETLKNYHLGFDLMLAILSKITLLPVNALYFQIVPIVLSLALGVLTHAFVLEWTKSKSKAFWAVFFVYFGGSFGWVVNLIRNYSFDGESMFWAQQSVSTLINPPFALSLILILAGLIFLQKSMKTSKVNNKWILFSIVFFGVTGFVKVYAGVLTLAGLFASVVWNYAIKKDSTAAKIFIGCFVINAILVIPMISFDSASLEFKPFWFLETMMALSDRVGWEKFYSAMTNYKLAGNWAKLILAYLVAFMIFIIGNFGSRLTSVVYVYKHNNKLGFIDVFLLAVIAVGIVIPMFFVQTGTAWNTIQFLYYSLFFTGILAGITIGRGFERGGKFKFVSIVIILLTIPTTFASLYHHYLPQRPPAMLPNEEIEALNFLSKQPEGVVLTYPFDPQKAKEALVTPPRPLYLYESTAYVSAYSQKEVYLEDLVNLNIMGYNWPERLSEIYEWYRSQEHEYVYNFLRDKNISYIYWLSGQRATLGEEQLGIEKVFDNDSVAVYKVK